MAGRRLTAFLRRQLPGLLRRWGHSPQVHLTRGPGHATLLAHRLAPRSGLVLVVGGDGTVNEVVAGLAGSPSALGVIPAGTANVLARELGLPLEPTLALRAVLRGEVRPMDLFRVNGRLGVSLAGAGPDAAVTRWMARSRRGHIGYLSYLEGIRREFSRHRFSPLELVVDGEPAGTFYQVIVANTCLYGGLFRLAPENRLDDGLLEVFGFAGHQRYRLYKHFAALALGCHRRLGDVYYRRGARIEVRAGPEVPYQVDGDFAGTGPLRVEVSPLALRVVVPRRLSSLSGRSRFASASA